MEKLIVKIKSCETMPKLDSLRMDCVNVGKEHGIEGFKTLQKLFLKQKNKLKRIPMRDRGW